MFIVLTKKPKLTAFLLLWLAVALFVFLSYRSVHSAHEWSVTALALKREHTFPSSWIAEYEINRRIRNGDLRNSEYLTHVLSIASMPVVDSEDAYALADRVLQSGLDIDSHGLGFTPLQAAINLNDSDAVAYFLSRCADPFTVTDIGDAGIAKQMNAFEFLNFLQETESDVDRSTIETLMNQWKPASNLSVCKWR